ncbi:hypothetical protein I317_07566 [Kwoniella heveanensis CBS 569]|nr:hypothetical protein I317_07566 [Kwoniella heveanensis CBS 569]
MSTQVSVKPFSEERVKGAHWVDERGKAFKNPWDSFEQFKTTEILKFQWQMLTGKDETLKQAKSLIPHMVPTFGHSQPREDLKVTWLGHAASLVELPTRPGNTDELKGRGVRVLFDPVLLDKMFHGIGPKRQSTVPCEISDLPEVDVIAISHNHYDHLDLASLTEIFATQQSKYDKQPLLFLPLNNWHVVSGLGLPRDRVLEMDWWDEREVVVEGVGEVKIVCTPCQHSTARTGWDRDNSLWSSWVLKDPHTSASVWFGGDTGYCNTKTDTHDLEEVSKYPVCPAFKQIGERLGPFTMGLIPIGAYKSRQVMSPLHASPIDSVRMFKDTKCEQAIGIHWGTFRMTPERFTEPPERLKVAAEAVGLKEDVFTVVAIGETRSYKV